MMNDLDNFKQAWKVFSETGLKNDYTTGDLKKIVRKNSNNELEKIRRKLIFEWSFTLILSVVLVFYIHFVNPNDTVYALIFIGVILGICFMPYLNVIRLKFTQHANLVSYLREFIFRFDKLVKQYIRMATILIPIAGLSGFLLGFHSVSSQQQWASFFNLFNSVMVFFCALIMSVAGYWLQGRYFKWVYGKNIDRLRSYLAELEHVDDSNLE